MTQELRGRATRLYPLPPREISAESIYEDLELPPFEHRNVSRPYVVINMVSSVDGRTAVGGKASRLGSQTDRRTMRNLRAKADAVMVGANTLRAEKLSLGLDDPSDKPQPLAIVATTTGDVPLETNLLLGEGQEVLLLSPNDEMDLGGALEMLKSEHNVHVLLVEGGPILNHALISGRLADELFLTLAPKLIGDSHQAGVLAGTTPVARDLSLLSAYIATDELFLRYSLAL